MTIKSLKKQLAAAIAMVMVSGVALGSSTYAWFVSNNSVTATTASISAQSNAPFLVIKNASAVVAATTDTSVTTEVADATLFPVQMVEANDAATTFKWESAYAAASNAATEKADTRFHVSEGDETKYYLKQTFYIGTNGTTAGQFKNLRVSGVEATSGADDDELKNALRVMVVCGAEVAIYDQSGTLVTTYVKQGETDPVEIGGLTAAEERSANGTDTEAAYLTTSTQTIGGVIGTPDSVKVDVYLYYDGAVANIRTNNIDKLGSVKATLTFTADDAAAPADGN